MKQLFTVAALLGLGACATPPEKIKPIASNGQPCTQADRDRLHDISGSQSLKARQDAWGVFWVGVPTGGGEDHSAEIARLKGKCGVP